MKFLSVVLIFLLCGQVFGVDGYSISASGSQDLNEHSDCQQVVNNGTLSIFVPTKTNTEWQSFQTNPPPSITINACPPSGGTWNSGVVCGDFTGAALCPGGTTPSGACATIGEKCYIGNPPYCACVAAATVYTCI